MSEEPQPQEQQPAWGDDISDERKAELDARVQAWAQEADHGDRKGPLDGVPLTGADVYYLAARTLAGAEGNVGEAMERLRRARDDALRGNVVLLDLNLSGANLINARLGGAFLGGARLSGAILSYATLTEAILSVAALDRAHLEGADLSGASLRNATLTEANLHEATLTGANLRNATLTEAILNHATLTEANLTGTTLTGADLTDTTLTRATLTSATLTEANLSRAWLDRTDLSWATLTGADLGGATLTEADLRNATLDRADLSAAMLTRATLSGATLIGADLEDAELQGATLISCRMDSATILTGIQLDTHTQLGDIVWNGAPLTRVDWGKAPRLGDEDAITEAKTRADRISALRDATRAYRGLATALRSQSMSIPASRYRLREQRLERRAGRLERHYGAWLFSWLLDLVSGYGEEPGRIFTAYLVVVLGFAAAYMGVTHFLETELSALRPDEALVLSLTSFHGRGFFPGFLQLGDWVARLGAAEAVIGLFIELILIATFSRRFLGN
jgi:uncharacterized protein YjbI with pentapeptide repeats